MKLVVEAYSNYNFKYLVVFNNRELWLADTADVFSDRHVFAGSLSKLVKCEAAPFKIVTKNDDVFFERDFNQTTPRQPNTRTKGVSNNTSL